MVSQTPVILLNCLLPGIVTYTSVTYNINEMLAILNIIESSLAGMSISKDGIFSVIGDSSLTLSGLLSSVELNDFISHICTS